MTLELAAWLGFCTIGLAASLLSLRFARLTVRALTGKADAELLAGVRHVHVAELERVIGWSALTIIGVVAPMLPATASFLVTWVVIAAVGVWAFGTASDYLYTRARWRALQNRAG